MIEIEAPNRELMVTIPIQHFVDLVEKSAKLDMFCQIIKSDSIYSKYDLYTILGIKKSPEPTKAIWAQEKILTCLL